MQIDCALLCDAATVREGMLHILGGGITRAYRPQFPAPVEMSLALLIRIHPAEMAKPHSLDVQLRDSDGKQLAGLQLVFGINDTTGLEPSEQAALPLSVRFPPEARLEAHGAHVYDVLIDGNHQVSVPFIAVQRPNP
jgi:hypothetical protein